MTRQFAVPSWLGEELSQDDIADKDEWFKRPITEDERKDNEKENND